MITTTYTCDRCGHAQDRDDEQRDKPEYRQMWQIRVVFGINNWSNSTEHQLWCRPCMEAMQLAPYFISKTSQPPVTPPTFEDKIREIVREEIRQ